MTRSDLISYETKAVNRNLIPLLIMALSGVIFGYLANSNAIMLDGLFSTILFLTIILSKFVQNVSNKPRSFDYPEGKWLTENLYILFKLVVLLTILFYSFVSSCHELILYFFFELHIEEMNHKFANYYYVVKICAFVVSILIYNYYYKLTHKNSQLLKLEISSVTVDGLITIGIIVGFFVLQFFPLLAPVSDPIVLLVLSVFLFTHVLHEFDFELRRILGKRLEPERERYYMNLFNNYFNGFEFTDVYIHFSGKYPIVNVTVNYTEKRSVQELKAVEHAIKKLMYKEFDKIFLYTYWDDSHLEYDEEKKQFIKVATTYECDLDYREK